MLKARRRFYLLVIMFLCITFIGCGQNNLSGKKVSESEKKTSKKKTSKKKVDKTKQSNDETSKNDDSKTETEQQNNQTQTQTQTKTSQQPLPVPAVSQETNIAPYGKSVCIDAGHQRNGNSGLEPIGPGSTTCKAKVAGGTRGTITGVPEYELTLNIALKLRDELRGRGYTVYMTRESNDVDISNAERAQYANSCNASCYIRLHADGAQSASVAGASAFFPSVRNPYNGRVSDLSNRLSACVMNGYTAATGIRRRTVSTRDDLSGTNWSQIPVTLLELGFMTNPTEDVNMSNPDFQNQMVRGIADGLDAYFQ